MSMSEHDGINLSLCGRQRVLRLIIFQISEQLMFVGFLLVVIA